MDEGISDEAEPSVGSRVEANLQVVHVHDGDDEDTDSAEEQLLKEMIMKLSAVAHPEPVGKMLFAAKAEELTRRNKAREARQSILQQPLQPASASDQGNHDEVNGNAIRSRRLGRSFRSRSCLSLTVRLTETSIKRYVQNVICRTLTAFGSALAASPRSLSLL